MQDFELKSLFLEGKPQKGSWIWGRENIHCADALTLTSPVAAQHEHHLKAFTFKTLGL